jgi:site-specific DNA-adenine methylase
MKPIIKWSGGKQDEIKKFEKYIPTPNEYNLYINATHLIIKNY